MQSFTVQPPTDYAHRPPVDYSEPLEATCFSFDARRDLLHSDTSLKYYFPMNKDISLEHGFETHVTRDLSKPEHLDALLASLRKANLVDSKKPPEATARRRIPTLITWRGILTKVAATPFDRREPWELRATLFKGTIYLEEADVESRIAREKTMDETAKRLAYGGYKFEALSTVPVPPQFATPEILKERESAVVNNNEQFCSVLKTRLEGDLMFLGAEVDASLAERVPGEQATRSYVELKTHRLLFSNNQAQLKAFHRKLLRIYLQSFLAGIPRIVIGFRNDERFVVEIQEFLTLDIPLLNQGDWDANGCLAFLKDFVEFLKKAVVKDDWQVVYRVRWDPRQDKVFVLEEDGGESFLPDWFVNDGAIPGK